MTQPATGRSVTQRTSRTPQARVCPNWGGSRPVPSRLNRAGAHGVWCMLLALGQFHVTECNRVQQAWCRSKLSCSENMLSARSDGYCNTFLTLADTGGCCTPSLFMCRWRYSWKGLEKETMLVMLEWSVLTRARPGGRLSAPSGFSQIANTCYIILLPYLFSHQFDTLKKYDPITAKVASPGHIKWPDLKLRFSKFDIVPKAHQWYELFETRSVQ